MPVVGIRAVTAATLTKVWMQIQAVIPPESSVPKRSGARSDARIPRQPRKVKATTTAAVPIRPSSSPMIAKMKSVWASGSQAYFRMELPSPTPVRPPRPSPKRAWVPCQQVLSDASVTDWPKQVIRLSR